MVTEVTGAETIYYQYDGCGNTVARQAPAGTTYYQYDTENLMTRIDFADGSHCYYTYDGDSKRVSQRTPEGYTEFIYQGPDMLKLQMERDESGNTQVQYTMGAGLESMRRDAGGGMASGDSSFFHYNALGTTVALTNPAQSVTDTYRHDAWGVLLAQTYTGQPTPNPHTYVGRERYYRMPTPDLYHLGFRDYAQRAGRFTRLDPARTSLQPYSYALNRPVALTDPLGLDPEQAIEKCHGRWQACIGEAVGELGHCIEDVSGIGEVFDLGPPLMACAAACGLGTLIGLPVGVFHCTMGCVVVRLGLGWVVGLWVCDNLVEELEDSCTMAYSLCCARLCEPWLCPEPYGARGWGDYPLDMWNGSGARPMRR